jgi:hypothetical protein
LWGRSPDLRRVVNPPAFVGWRNARPPFQVSLKRRELGSRLTKNLIEHVKANCENPGFEAQYIAEVDGLLQNDRPQPA